MPKVQDLNAIASSDQKKSVYVTHTVFSDHITEHLNYA